MQGLGCAACRMGSRDGLPLSLFIVHVLLHMDHCLLLFVWQLFPLRPRDASDGMTENFA